MPHRVSRRQALGLAALGAGGAAAVRFIALPGASAGSRSGGATAVTTPANAGWASPLANARARAAHLLRRAGFGYTHAELDTAARMRFTDLVDKVVHEPPDPLQVPDKQQYATVTTAWYAHMASTPAQFPERMTLFWHGLLTSDYRKAAGLPLVGQQNALYRKLGTGDLRSLLVAVTADPLMMRYLDLETSTAKAPNENYSRELMELFTLGLGNFTETDVREGARALSGMRIVTRDPSGTIVPMPRMAQKKSLQGYTFSGVLDPRRHDGGVKTYLGRTGNLGPDDVIDTILSHDACAPFIATKALVHFLGPSPSADLVARVAGAFRKSHYDVKTMMRAIFLSDEFLSAATYRASVRSPADYMVATMRVLGRPQLAPMCVRAGEGMDQVLYDMPTVAGWPTDAGWVSSSSWLARVNFAQSVVSSTSDLPDPLQAVGDQLDGVVGADTAQVFNASRTTTDKWFAILASPEFHLK